MPAGRESAGQREGGPAGSDGMVLYLKQMLKDLEQAQGGEDTEAAAALAELERHTAALAVAVESSSSGSNGGAAGGAPPEQDTLQLASEIDRLDDILNDLEAKLEGADGATREILQNSTQLWLGKEQQPSEPPGEPEPEEGGPIRRQPPASGQGGGVR